MEDSKLYSTQEIERLKQKIETYRETLTSLKMGTSIEEFLFMKNEFDGLKTQIAHLEGLTETLDDKQNSHIKGYEDQIKLLSTQIESLNQTIEEMNQEIFMVLNRLITIEVNEASTTLPAIEKNANSTANDSQRHPRITQTADQSTITSKQPSYKLLQSLAGKATNMQVNLNNGIPSAQNDIQGNKPEERHFNQQYFQSINTQPSQIYNGLYRNTTVESTFHFKKATDAQEIPVSVYNPNTVSSAINNESFDNNALNSSIVNESVNDVESEKINASVDYGNSKRVVETDNQRISPKINDSIGHVNSQRIVESVNDVNSEIVNEPGNLVDAGTVNEPGNLVDAGTVNEPGNLIDSGTVNEPGNLVDAGTVNEPGNLVDAGTVNEPGNLVDAGTVNEPGYSNNSPTITPDEIVVFETKSGESNEIHISLEEVNKQHELIKESTVEENKKVKNSFFNFFRKWS